VEVVGQRLEVGRVDALLLAGLERDDHARDQHPVVLLRIGADRAPALDAVAHRRRLEPRVAGEKPAARQPRLIAHGHAGAAAEDGGETGIGRGAAHENRTAAKSNPIGFSAASTRPSSNFHLAFPSRFLDPSMAESPSAHPRSQRGTGARKHRSSAPPASRLSDDAAPVAGRAGLVDTGVCADARGADVPGRAGLIETRVALNVPGRAGLIDPGIPADARSAHVPGRAGLIETRVAVNVSGRARLVDSAVPRVQHRAEAHGHGARNQRGDPVDTQSGHRFNLLRFNVSMWLASRARKTSFRGRPRLIRRSQSISTWIDLVGRPGGIRRSRRHRASIDYPAETRNTTLVR
jgi:hypothetical protein